MKNKTVFKWAMVVAVLLFGCAGCERSCSASCANSFGSDWVVAQYDYAGEPVQCWKLSGDSVQNEADGVYWLDRSTGNIIHISGWFNFVQVNGDYDSACQALGVECRKCTGGVYESGK